MLTASVECQLVVLSMLDCELASEDGGWWLTYEISEGLFLSHSPHRTFLGTESGKPIDSNPDFSAFGFVIRMKASFLKACEFLEIHLLRTYILFLYPYSTIDHCSYTV